MKKKVVVPLPPKINMLEVSKIASNASQVIDRVRANMLAPDTKKIPPIFGARQMADLCGLEKDKLSYLLKKDPTLPAGVKVGARIEWTLAEARQLTKILNKENLRVRQTAGAVVITIANFKGGVGKTTTAAALAQGLSLKGHQILVIDLDPQGSLTSLFGFTPAANRYSESLLEVFTGARELIDDCIQPTYWDGIDIVCASPTLFGAEFSIPRLKMGNPNYDIMNILNYSLAEAAGKYDIIIIDSSPSLSYLTLNAMMASNGIIMPVPPNALDFASSAQFWQLFSDILDGAAARKSFHFIDIILSRVDKSDAVGELVKQWMLSAYREYLLNLEIPKTSVAATASAEFGTVYDIDTSSVQMKTLKRARDAYDMFVEYVETQIVSIWENDKKLEKMEKLDIKPVSINHIEGTK